MSNLLFIFWGNVEILAFTPHLRHFESYVVVNVQHEHSPHLVAYYTENTDESKVFLVDLLESHPSKLVIIALVTCYSFIVTDNLWHFNHYNQPGLTKSMGGLVDTFQSTTFATPWLRHPLASYKNSSFG